MKKKFFKLLSCLLIVMTVIGIFSQTAFALEWDGSTAGGGGGGYPAGPNGYAVRTTDDNCLGYRFSGYEKRYNKIILSYMYSAAPLTVIWHITQLISLTANTIKSS